MEKIRYAGAQLPCTEHLDRNIKEIKTAINWAAENKVDYLLTPEGSLSDNLETAIQSISKDHPTARVLICGSLYLAGEVLKNN